MRTVLVAMASSLVLVGCSALSSKGRDAPELIDEYGCGYGFHVGSADQTAGLFLDYNDWDAAGSDDLSPDLAGEEWTAELRFGADLFANWCDDVLEPDEPEPVVDEVWLVSGRIEVDTLPEGMCGGAATATLSDVTARSDEGGTISLGDMEVGNDAWGCFAG